MLEDPEEQQDRDEHDNVVVEAPLRKVAQQAIAEVLHILPSLVTVEFWGFDYFFLSLS